MGEMSPFIVPRLRAQFLKERKRFSSITWSCSPPRFDSDIVPELSDRNYLPLLHKLFSAQLWSSMSSSLLQTLKHCGGVDFLVCTAGVNSLVGSALGSSEQVWDKVRTGEDGRGWWDFILAFSVPSSTSTDTPTTVPQLPHIQPFTIASIAQGKARGVGSGNLNFSICEREARMSKLQIWLTCSGTPSPRDMSNTKSNNHVTDILRE